MTTHIKHVEGYYLQGKVNLFKLIKREPKFNLPTILAVVFTVGFTLPTDHFKYWLLWVIKVIPLTKITHYTAIHAYRRHHL